MCRPGSDPEKIQVHTPPFTRRFRRFEELDDPQLLEEALEDEKETMMPQGDPIYTEIVRRWRKSVKNKGVRKALAADENDASHMDTDLIKSAYSKGLKDGHEEGYAEGKALYRADIDLIQIYLQRLEQAIEELSREIDSDK